MPIQLSTDATPIQYIYHMADIHIRADNTRHDEYRGVFLRTHDYIKSHNTPNDTKLIIICGDILHNKTTLKPECINLFKDFMIQMTDICDVIMIIGNHDCNMNNQMAMNAIEPLLKKLHTKHNIYLLNEDTIYEYRNLNIGLTTLFSKAVTQIPKSNNRNNIGLYHGALNECMLDNGTTLGDLSEKGEHFSIKDFANYDYVMLGDIHKHQFITPTIAYPSSLIQQNYGESLHDHGLIVWDLAKGIGEFVRIRNNYGFVQLDYDRKGLHNYDPAQIPPRARIQLTYRDVNFDKVDEIKQELYKKHEIVEFIKQRDNTGSEPVKINIELDNGQTLTHFNSPDQVIAYICNFVKKNKIYPDTTDMANTIRTVLSNYDTDKGDKIRNIKLKSINFGNLFCYGENNHIVFDKFKNIVGLVANNYMGKSSLIDIILFSLFNKISKGEKNTCIGMGKKKYNTDIVVDINGIDHKITRSGKITGKHNELKTDVTYSINNVMANKDDKKATDAEIVKNICTFDDITNLSVILQTSRSFFDMNQRDRRDFLNKVLRLDLLNTLKTQCITLSRQEQYTISTYNKKYNEFKNCDHAKELDKLNDNKTKIDARIAKLDIKIAERRTELQQIGGSKKVSKSYQDNYDITSMMERREELDNMINNYDTHITQYNDEIAKYTDDINNITNKPDITEQEYADMQQQLRSLYGSLTPITKTDIFDATHKLPLQHDMIANTQATITIINNKIEKLRGQIRLPDEIDDDMIANNNAYIKYKQDADELKQTTETIKRDIQKLNNQYDKLCQHEYNPECDACSKNPVYIEQQRIQSDIAEHTAKLDETKSAHKKKTKKVDKYEEYHTQYNTCVANKSHNTTIRADITKCETDIMRHDMTIEKIQQTISRYEKIIEDNKNNDVINKDIAKYANIVAQYDSYNKQMTELVKRRNDVTTKLSQMERNRSAYDKEYTGLIRDIKEYERMDAEYNEYKKAKKRIDKINEDIETLMDEHKSLQTEINRINMDIHTINITKQEYDKLVAEINAHTKTKQSYDDIVKLYENHKLMDDIMRNMMKSLEDTMNMILYEVAGFSVRIEYLDDEINVYRQIGDNRTVDITYGSGFEKFITNISFRLALNQINNYVRTNFFIIDEGFTALDPENIQKLSSLFEFCRNHYTWTLIVTHLDQIKNNFDQIITIERVESKEAKQDDTNAKSYDSHITNA